MGRPGIRTFAPRAVLVSSAAVLLLTCFPWGIRAMAPQARIDVACGPSSAPPVSALGAVAYLRGEDLHVVDVASGVDRTIVTDAAPPHLGYPTVVPVRWSPDGRWIAYGNGTVVPSAGGTPCEPLGRGIASWSWSPTGNELAGTTDTGALTVGGPEQPPRSLLPAGWGATADPVFDPTGRFVAVARIRRGPSGLPARGSLWIVDLATGNATALARVHRSLPIIAGWTPDGRSILWWNDLDFSSSIAADGLQLRMTELGGTSRWLVKPVLVHDDFFSWCGDRLVVAAGGGRDVLSGKRLFVFSPPRWFGWTSPGDRPPNWIWPACSPDGRWVAASAGVPPAAPYRYGREHREIWLVAPHGSHRHELIAPSNSFADDLPRWSADGRSILFVRRTLSRRPTAALFLANVDPANGGLLSIRGPIASLGRAARYDIGYGDYAWSEGTDWFRPAA